ncbi:hypothetical protein QE152_g25000 [Popillia japonica]|uniref:Chromo domain-containing protein n=1 Tax=Popillia japonica TaxID=7064 RepID=A0AAW1K1W6_POPJA
MEGPEEWTAARQFIDADDTAVAAQGTDFTEVEEKLEAALKSNPSKTQVCAFHLKNKDARWTLKIHWRGERLEQCTTPRYLGVYPLIGVAPPSVRRAAATDAERPKQETNARHSLHQHEPAGRRLRSRKSFMARSHTLKGSIENNRVTRWTQQLITREPPRKEIAPGKRLPFAVWKSLNG